MVSPQSNRLGMRAHALCTLVGLAAWLALTPAFADGYQFIVPEQEAFPGETLTFPIDGDYEQSVQGFSLALSFPADQLTVHSVSVVDTIVEAINADFIDIKVLPELDILTVAVLTDAGEANGILLPAIGQPLAVAYVEATTAAENDDDIDLQFVDGVRLPQGDGQLAPPLFNVFVVDNDSVPVDELTTSQIDIQGTESFLRGDCNHDLRINIADPIMILDFLFTRTVEMGCERAADANADATVNIADSLYLLRFLFQFGTAPPEPFPNPGRDYFLSRNLSCVDP